MLTLNIIFIAQLEIYAFYHLFVNEISFLFAFNDNKFCSTLLICEIMNIFKNFC